METDVKRADVVASLGSTVASLRREMESLRTQVLRLQAEKVRDRADLAECRAELEETRKEAETLAGINTGLNDLYQTYRARCRKVLEKYGPERKSYTPPRLLEDCVLQDPVCGSGG